MMNNDHIIYQSEMLTLHERNDIEKQNYLRTFQYAESVNIGWDKDFATEYIGKYIFEHIKENSYFDKNNFFNMFQFIVNNSNKLMEKWLIKIVL